MYSTLDIGNFFLFISGFLMIYTAYKDRNVLKRYNLIGSAMLAIDITFVMIFYLQERYYISTFFTLPNYGYWLMVVFSLISSHIN
jgi:hypothetical protein